MMNLKELDRRALLGDRKAQDECTENGIVLPCPFCGGKAVAFFDYDCELFGVRCRNQAYSGYDMKADYNTSPKFAVAGWNTRYAPPVGRCMECRHSTVDLDYGKTWCNLSLGCREVKPDGFCNEFKPKEDKEK